MPEWLESGEIKPNNVTILQGLDALVKKMRVAHQSRQARKMKR